MLKEEEANLSMRCCFRMGRFSSVGLHGKIILSAGGRVLAGQEHGFSPGATTPVLVQAGTMFLMMLVAATSASVGMLGKFCSTTPRAFMVPRDR